jgi:hypothetical protein
MEIRLNVTRVRVLALAGGLGLLAGGVGIGSMVSAHGGDATKVHACYKNLPPTYNGDIRNSPPQVNTNPNVRIIGANENCQAGETALDWSQQGGVTGRETVSAYTGIPGAGQHLATATCPAGKKALGGGGGMNIGTGSVNMSFPWGDDSLRVFVNATSAGQVAAFVICGVAS